MRANLNFCSIAPFVLVIGGCLSYIYAKPVAAETLTMELNRASPAFAGYYWEAFRFDGPVEEGAVVAMRSSDFDSYLLVITPDGRVLTNDDHSLPLEKLGNDAGLALATGGEGKWFVVATTLSSGDDGSFELLTEGLPPLQPTGLIEDKTLAVAFDARGVVDPEIARQEAIASVAEQLSLASFRADLEETLRAEIVRAEQEQASARQSLSEAEKKEAELAAALGEIRALPSHQNLVRSLVQESLTSAQTNVEYYAEAAFEALGRADGFKEALANLAELNRLSTHIKQIESVLLDTALPSLIDLQRLGPELIEGRAAFDFLAAKLAERLEDMGILEQLRFSQFNTATSIDIIGMAPMSGIVLESAAPPEVITEVDPTALMPELFPWPPPEASARATISRSLFGSNPPATLGEVADTLAEALSEAGYTGPGYLGVPRGFAMVTRIEQTDRSGRPLDGNARWASQIIVVKSFSISAVLRALMTAEPGFFRILVLVITDKPFDDSGAQARLETLEAWSRKGVDVLVPDVREMPFDENYKVSALVYEFEKASENEDPIVRVPGNNEAPTHLTHTRFARFIQ